MTSPPRLGLGTRVKAVGARARAKISHMGPFFHNLEVQNCPAHLHDLLQHTKHSHMHHCVLKEHQVHDGIELIVGLQGFLEDLVQALPRSNRKVFRLPDASSKVAVKERFCFQGIIIKVLQLIKRKKNFFSVLYKSTFLHKIL